MINRTRVISGHGGTRAYLVMPSREKPRENIIYRYEPEQT